MNPDIHMRSAAIKAEALQLGFADCGFSKAEELPGDAERLKEWLRKGYHARMDYMANHFEKRTNPALLVEGAKTVISVLYNYYTDKIQEDPAAPIISKYSYGKDYHFVLKEKLRTLFDFIKETYGPVSGRIFVDSAPVLDRAWARKAGLGWIGKNSNLISREHGSFVFIGEIICDLEAEYNTIPENDFCGSCNRCIEACPTDAILSDRTLDSRRCISYQTIEKREDIDEDIKPLLSNRVFGCDICQDVCPWNRKAVLHSESAFEPAEELLFMKKEDWFNLSMEKYKRLFKDSPVTRAGHGKLMNTLSGLTERSTQNKGR